MAVDKLVDSTQLDADLTNVANAIRTKGGTSAQMAFPAGFVSAVNAIPTGVTPTGTKQISITQNGTTTEDVTNYANAEITVNVPSSGSIPWDDFVTHNQMYDCVINASGIADYALRDLPVKSIYAPNLTAAVAYFAAAITLESAIFPSFVDASKCQRLFQGCSEKLVSVSLQNLATGNLTYLFHQCSGLTSVVLPSFNGRLNSNNFRKCTSLIAIDTLSPTISNAYEFVDCSNLVTIILRGSSVATLEGLTSFNGTPFASNGTGGTLYVPQSLVASYQAETNWSTLLGYPNNQILPIEGSIYETQYADGTPIT